MTRTGLIALLLASLVGGAGSAQVAQVRSGEHVSFTRLAVDLPIATQWNLEQADRKATLTITSGVTAFDLDGVFDRIGRDRVAAIYPGSGKGTLSIDLGCDCRIKGFLTGQRMLVLDVVDSAEQQMPGVLFPLTEKLSFGKTATAETEIDLPVILKDLKLPDTLDRPIVGAHAEAVKSAENRLLEQLGRAATQGLVTPVRHRLQQRPAESETPSKPVLTAPVGPEPNLGPLRAVTSRDAALLRNMRIGDQLPSGADCIPDAKLNIAEWGAETFNAGLAARRGRLYGEFDRVDVDAAIGLARFYLFYGFGAEARRSLDIAGAAAPMLRVMTWLVDGHPAPDPGPFSGQAVCDGSVALWAVLAAPVSRATLETDEKAVLRGYLSLPEALRARLGPDLGRKMNQFGYTDTAEMVLRRLELAEVEKTPERHIAEAEIAAAENRAEKTVEALEAAIESNSQQSPIALARLIEEEIAAGREILPEIADLAGAFAFENRQNDLSGPLAWAAVLARAGAGQFDEAFDALERIQDPVPDDHLAQIFRLLHDKATDDEFIKLLLPRLDSAAELPAGAGNELAERLLAIGFAKPAERLLLTAASGAEGRKRRLIRAEAALDLKLPRRAEAEILGLSGKDADDIRARARSMAGDHAVAARVFSSLEDSEQSRRQAFLAGDWPLLSDTEDPVLSALARLKAKGQAEEDQGLLARNRALLNESSDVRAVLENVLGQYTVDDAGGAGLARPGFR